MGLLILFAAAPIYRYLLGMHMLDTGGSLLAVAIQHASWNAAQKLEAVEGGTWNWQVIAALVVLTACVAVGRRLWRSERHPIGTDAETAAADHWQSSPSTRAASKAAAARATAK
jgi:hypothetical protein